MTKKETIQHYKNVSTEILIGDYVYCLCQHRKGAYAIYSSLKLMFDGHKKLLDDSYIKEKLNHAINDTKEFHIIQDEIRKRITAGTLTQEYYEERLKYEKGQWGGTFAQTI